MIKLKKLIALFVVFAISSCTVYADPLDYGIFGGITEGRKLAKTTEQLLAKNTNSASTLTSTYKEIVFLTGTANEFEGNITITNKNNSTADSGTYKVTYKIVPGDTTADNISINRNIQYNVNYRTEETQTIRDYEVSSWTETIVSDGQTFRLDASKSKSSISIIEDKTPGVTYYKGDISHRAVYTSDGETITQDISGVIYGYTSAWSSTETQKLNVTITTDSWQMEYQIRPSVSVGKSLEYSENEPTAISFSGNYKEVMQNKSGLSYNIYVLPTQFTYTTSSKGSISIPSFNTFEQLIAPDISYLKGHFAEEDIKKLFAMQILDGDPKFYQPSQAITRGQFTEMLVKAIKLPIEETSSKNSKTPVELVFSDVTPDREEYPYIMAAFSSGLAVGKTDGKFHIDDPIERQEAVVILLRALGLENLGLDPTPVTTFTDDAYIDSWAKREIYAANRIGIIAGDEDGKFKPKSFINKAEAAAIVNRLINYMRSDMQVDYTENIVNFAD